jgi:hypothetical protein
MLRYLWFVCSAVVLAQPPSKMQIKPSTATPHANETVILEVIGIASDAPGQVIRWEKQDGQGNFGSKTIGPKVEFTPTKAGDVVTIVCQLVGAQPDSVSTRLTVAKEEAAAQDKTLPAEAATAVSHPKPPPPSPQTMETLPAGAVKITEIVDPNKALVVPSGFMGDAIPEFGKGAAQLRGGADCRFKDGGCYSITYEMARRELPKGFTAYAWQVLPQGTDTGYNFGQSPGVDLSKKGYQSLRVFARAAPESMLRSPKVEFKSGGNIDPQFASAHPRSYIVSTGPKTLNENWQELCLDLSKADLRDVVSPLTVVISSALNPAVNVAVSIDGAAFSKQECPRR